MADYFGNLLIEPQSLQHQGAFFKSAVELIHQVQQAHDIQDTLVVVERTGNYYLPPKRAFASAGFETLVIHPFATKPYRMPGDPGTRPMKRIYMRNIERRWRALACASLS